MQGLTDSEKYILNQEFPDLSLSGDVDIERYFIYRKQGREKEAIFLYDNKLRLKYPNETLRIALISAYRKKDPVFISLLTQCLKSLANRTIERTKIIINFISESIGNIPKTNILSIVRQCENVVSSISQDRYQVIPFTEKYSRYASYFNFKKKEMKEASHLIKLYISGEFSYLAMREEARIENEKKEKKILFDFSKVTFTKAQESLILISPSIKRIEDKVIAYIAQYLPTCLDSSFENLVLLYSRKYRSKHYDIFKAIKSIVIAKKTDEELLTNVLMTVCDGYYYSISGDIYLQKEWAKLKNNLIEAKTKKDEKKPQQKELPSKEKKLHNFSKKEKRMQNKKTIPKDKTVIKARKADIIIESKEKAEVLHKKCEKDIQNTPMNRETAERVQKLESIKDCIKRIIGDNYGIYDELFFKTVRISIRHVLEKSMIQKMSLFGDEENLAEDSIYEYIEKNYENPYQNWILSENNKQVETLGFKVSSIEEILKDWAYYNKF